MLVLRSFTVTDNGNTVTAQRTVHVFYRSVLSGTFSPFPAFANASQAALTAADVNATAALLAAAPQNRVRDPHCETAGCCFHCGHGLTVAFCVDRYRRCLP
jgi:hypothetical protein